MKYLSFKIKIVVICCFLIGFSSSFLFSETDGKLVRIIERVLLVDSKYQKEKLNLLTESDYKTAVFGKKQQLDRLVNYLKEGKIGQERFNECISDITHDQKKLFSRCFEFYKSSNIGSNVEFASEILSTKKNTSQGDESVRVGQAVETLKNSLINKFDRKKNCWAGRQWMNAAVTAEFVILCKYIGYDNKFRLSGAVKEIMRRQNADGGFNSYYNGPSNLSITCSCYLALELAGVDLESPFMKKTKEFILANGGLENAMLINKFYYALFGKYPLAGIPRIPVELMFVPKFTGVSIYDMSSWTRVWIVPLSIVRHYEKLKLERVENINDMYELISFVKNTDMLESSQVTRQTVDQRLEVITRGIEKNLFEMIDKGSKYLEKKRGIKNYIREKALKKAHQWLLDHQETDGSWYAVFQSTMVSVMALHNLGYKLDSPQMKKALDFIHSLQDLSEGTVRQQPFLGPVWDSAFSILSLIKAGLPPDHELAGLCKDFFLKRQNNKYGDWQYEKKVTPGGWGFEFTNDYYPDFDDTAEVLMALHMMDKNGQLESRIGRGLDWLLTMQNSNGSWGAFDRNNNHKIIEFGVHFKKYNIGQGSGLILDFGTPDLTAHVIEALGELGFTTNAKVIKKAVRWLKKAQCADGSWFGRWGLCYVYGTAAVLNGLHAVGEDMESPCVRRGVAFLKKCQNPDGGFGEVPEAFYDLSKKGVGISTPTQTAWVISGLISAGEGRSPEVVKGINYLITNIQADGTYDEKYFQAVAAPPLYQRYELYPFYFPLFTLQAYLDYIENVKL